MPPPILDYRTPSKPEDTSAPRTAEQMIRRLDARPPILGARPLFWRLALTFVGSLGLLWLVSLCARWLAD